MITNKTIKSKYQPKQTNVTWVDLSGKTPVEKHFINGKWREMSGGGAGSSNPTEADATKVWQVTPVQKGTKTESFEILHEYTDTFHYDENLITDATNLDKFTAGSKCILIVTGDTEYDGNIYEGFINSDLNVVFNETSFAFYITSDGLVFNYGGSNTELTLSLSVEQETPIYDYNWAPGVKIPIPTAEDKGKILVVTNVKGDNVSTIVPEQEVPADIETPLTNVDLTKFVVGNTVRVTIPENSETFTATGVIEEDGGIIIVNFIIDGTYCAVAQIDNLLYTNAGIEFNDSTIKLEYIEFNYEYQLQSGGSEKVVTLENWAYVDNGGESILTDIDGNKFYEGQDFTIEYNTEVSSNNPFDLIKRINVGGNYQCDKIVIVTEEGAKYIKIPVFINTDSRGSNYAVFGDTETNRIGTLVVG